MAWQFVHYEQVGSYYDFGFLDTKVEEIASQVDYVFRMNRYFHDHFSHGMSPSDMPAQIPTAEILETKPERGPGKP